MTKHSRELIKALKQLDVVKCGVEVGTWRGHTSKALLETFPNLYLHLVDLYQDEQTDSHLLKTMSAKEAYSEAQSHVEPFKNRCSWHITKSFMAAESIADSTIDFAFIDADHSYESVRQDIDAYLPKIRPGGILAGHDFGGYYKGVKKAVYETFVQAHVIVPVGRSRIWYTFIGEKKEQQAKGLSIIRL